MDVSIQVSMFNYNNNNIKDEKVNILTFAETICWVFQKCIMSRGWVEKVCGFYYC